MLEIMRLGVVVAIMGVAMGANRSFEIGDGVFLKDGAPFRLMSGSIHYQRVHPSYWDDRLSRLRAMGLNAIEVYSFWGPHNPEQGTFDFTGENDVVGFMRAAQRADLLVLWRIGPYGCGEFRGGGLPDWMVGEPGLEIRTNNSVYLGHVDAWFSQLLSLAKLQKLLYSDGGPVVMVQIENEFGSYGDVSGSAADKAYMEHLLGLARQYLGGEVVVYTTDGGSESYFSKGTLPGPSVYSAGDGGDLSSIWAAEDAYNSATSPKMSTEWYVWWLTHWTDSHMANGSASNAASSLATLFNNSFGSVSIYMAHGGTNFGQWNGANGGGRAFQPVVTSYDYGAPLSEPGHHNWGSDGRDTYAALQTVLLETTKRDKQPLPPPEPAPNPTMAYPPLSLSSSLHLYSTKSLSTLCEHLPPTYEAPPTMEVWGQKWGLASYSTILQPLQSTSTLAFDAFDRSIVLLDGVVVGSPLWRPDGPFQVSIGPTSTHTTLTILVEDAGRINYGHGMFDKKGIQDATVTLDGKNLTGSWQVCGIPLTPSVVSNLPFLPTTTPANVNTSLGPVFTMGSFSIDVAPQDTWVYPQGFSKGFVFVNNAMLGRYWNSAGPQQALYLPAPMLRQGLNTFILLELDSLQSAWNTSTNTPTLHFSNKPVWGSPPACTLPSTPEPAQQVVIYTCQSSTTSSIPDTQTWTFSSSKLSPTSNPSLCLTKGPGTDPQSGAPAARLESCLSPLPDNQTFSYDTSSKAIVCADANHPVLDITSHDSFDGARVELYASNGGANQQWDVLPSGEIKTLQDGRCLSLCNEQ